jgi:hypothetical protein
VVLPFFRSSSPPRVAVTAGESTATLSSLTGEVWLTDSRQSSVKASSAQAFYSGEISLIRSIPHWRCPTTAASCVAMEMQLAY